MSGKKYQIGDLRIAEKGDGRFVVELYSASWSTTYYWRSLSREPTLEKAQEYVRGIKDRRRKAELATKTIKIHEVD